MGPQLREVFALVEDVPPFVVGFVCAVRKAVGLWPASVWEAFWLVSDEPPLKMGFVCAARGAVWLLAAPIWEVF